MAEVFDRKLLFDNITFLVKRAGLKIGEVEQNAGVSAGYIARTTKDGNAKPGIEFIIGMAEQLNVSTDLLLKTDLSKIDANAAYLIGFIEKLIRDTVENRLYWERETAEDLDHLEWDDDGMVNHPLFITDYRTDTGRTVLFNSRSFSYRTQIAGDCFNLGLKNGARLYVMYVTTGADGASQEKEIWMDVPRTGAQYLCGTLSGAAFATPIENLYSYVAEELKHPSLRPDLKAIIDGFMTDYQGGSVTPKGDKVDPPF